MGVRRRDYGRWSSRLWALVVETVGEVSNRPFAKFSLVSILEILDFLGVFSVIPYGMTLNICCQQRQTFSSLVRRGAPIVRRGRNSSHRR